MASGVDTHKHTLAEWKWFQETRHVPGLKIDAMHTEITFYIFYSL